MKTCRKPAEIPTYKTLRKTKKLRNPMKTLRKPHFYVSLRLFSSSHNDHQLSLRCWSDPSVDLSGSMGFGVAAKRKHPWKTPKKHDKKKKNPMKTHKKYKKNLETGNLWPNQNAYQRVAPKQPRTQTNTSKSSMFFPLSSHLPLFFDVLLSRRFPLVLCRALSEETAPWWPLLLSGSYFTLNAPPLVVETFPSTPPPSPQHPRSSVRSALFPASSKGRARATRESRAKGFLKTCALDP